MLIDYIMGTIKCPNCDENVVIDIAHSISEDGEVFMCPSCKYIFSYVER